MRLLSYPKDYLDLCRKKAMNNSKQNKDSKCWLLYNTKYIDNSIYIL